MSFLPKIGTSWIWEPNKPHARETVIVSDLKWNGEEWWIESEAISTGQRYWNNFGRWREAMEGVGDE